MPTMQRNASITLEATFEILKLKLSRTIARNYQTSVYYMDIVNAFERMGDFLINISQDLERTFAQK